MTCLVLEALHEWKQKNCGNPAKITLSPEGRDRAFHEMRWDGFTPKRRDPTDLFGIPFEVVDDQAEFIELH